MDDQVQRFLHQHFRLTRRHFVKAGVLTATSLTGGTSFAEQDKDDPRLQDALKSLETWLTRPGDFQDVSRGKPKPHTLSEDEKKKVGLTRDTWKLNVVSDPDNPASIQQPLEGETAFRFDDLMELARDHAVRFPKVMTCLNIGCPLGNGIWEGVPLREIIWRTQPKEDLRRVFYYGYHNDKPEQMFRSSLPVGRILEDPFGLPPVILCYKLNGEWLTSERGGPVRVVVPEAYGFKSIKWLNNVVLSNLHAANDTYAEKNNDVDSPLKTFCATLTAPTDPKANEAIPITGYAQVGISGLKKVQVWISRRDEEWPRDDPYFTKADWQDATLLAAPKEFGGGLPNEMIPADTMHFDDSGRPKQWPILLSKAHWCHLHPGLPAGKYVLRCRTVDNNGHAQPMPRPFRKSGHAKIETIRFEVS
ncbi:molybdopterin-dependent oxidoreductase [Fuerstiella marisgermanici]|uniref:TMAO/DMSO reductase n=1 Tax=Fuerstiella marisgermanici TaxID=1891926 RepID=A0A1P8WC44_9PLAN|nr:molybdopterin-dependent oxidoreductase [Fuerstiella marisgermanici]APZ91616.1 TMAO/DMSO reductase [Fuerstiella marisgermanici]